MAWSQKENFPRQKVLLVNQKKKWYNSFSLITFIHEEDIARWRGDINFIFGWQEYKVHIFELKCHLLLIKWQVKVIG